MSKISHYRSSLPKWKFWARMKRNLTDQDGNPVGFLKKSWTQTVTLLDEAGEVLVRPKLQLGVLADLFDSKDKLMGSVRSLHVKAQGFLAGNADVWGIAKDGEKYLVLIPRERSKVVNQGGKHDVEFARANKFVYIIVKNEHSIGTLIPSTGGFFENFDLILEDGVSEEDRLLCLALMGYKMHGLLK